MPASYYQQFDADITRDVPAEAYGGWRHAKVELSVEHTGVVLMHAWDTATSETFPGWYRAVEYLPRAAQIIHAVLPPLLGAVRASPMPLFHVVAGGDYYQSHPGYRRARDRTGSPTPRPTVEADPTLRRLRQFRTDHVFPGAHNLPDIQAQSRHRDFAPGTEPTDDEGVAEDTAQLFALCRDAGVNHLLYAGFALNWCLLRSPGGMNEMSQHGVMCSALRQAVTSVENKQTARLQLGNQIALWQVALAFGFVFDVDELVTALEHIPPGC